MKTFLKKITLWTSLLATVSLIVITPLSSVQAISIGELEQKQSELNQQIEDSQEAAEQKEQEALTLEKQVSLLEKDISNTEAKIVETNGQISQVQNEISTVKSDISETEEKLNEQIANFNQAVVELYRAGRRSDMEKILGSADLAEAVEQTTYLDSLQEHVNGIVNEITDTKNNLESQKTSLEDKNSNLQSLAEQQNAARRSAEAQQNQKLGLLSDTISSKEEYDALVSKLQKERSQVSAALYAERAKMVGSDGEQWGGGGSGYPFSCGIIDPWKFYSCQCTSYAAWYWNAVLGKPWTNTRPGEGSAWNWPNLARDQGYSVSSTPQVGAIISWQASALTSGWGHVAIVEAVNGDGTIDISEYNWSPAESFSRRMHVNPGNYGGYSYIY